MIKFSSFADSLPLPPPRVPDEAGGASFDTGFVEAVVEELLVEEGSEEEVKEVSVGEGRF